MIADSSLKMRRFGSVLFDSLHGLDDHNSINHKPVVFLAGSAVDLISSEQGRLQWTDILLHARTIRWEIHYVTPGAMLSAC